MKMRYVRANEGNKFAPTEEGNKIGRISAKFEHDYPKVGVYEKSVPEAWVRDGLVMEVPICPETV